MTHAVPPVATWCLLSAGGAVAGFVVGVVLAVRWEHYAAVLALRAKARRDSLPARGVS